MTKIFADKWYLPANLYKVEQRTGLKYRRGHFSDSERLLAMKFTTKYCKDQNMTLEEFKKIFFDDMGTNNSTNNSKRLNNFFVDCSQHFGGRPVVAVYQFLKRLYHPGNHRGAWNTEDDEALLREYQKYGPKWALIGKELNRLGTNCRDRYNLKWKHVGSTLNGAWTPEEDEKLKKGIEESLKGSGTISWIWVAEEKVKSRTPLQCLSRFKIIKNRNSTPELGNPKPKPKLKKEKEIWNGWTDDFDQLLIHELELLVIELSSEDSIDWKSLIIKSLPPGKLFNYEFLFRRWNYLKGLANSVNDDNNGDNNNNNNGDNNNNNSSNDNNFRVQIEKVKNYLINNSKSAAYIFSEDEEEL